jgi:hypothetical protein
MGDMADHDREMFESFGFSEPMTEDEKKLQYLEWLRDVAFSNKTVAYVTCHKYPEFGVIQRGSIHNVISNFIEHMDEDPPLDVHDGPDTYPTITKQQLKYYSKAERAQLVQAYSKADVQATWTLHNELLNYQEGTDMKTFNADFYSRQADEMLRKAELARGVPEDDDAFVDGTVITWKKNYFNNSRLVGTVYKYAAIKAAGMWYITGRETGQYTWTNLLQFIGLDNIDTVLVLDSEGIPLKDFVAGVQQALEGTVGITETVNGTPVVDERG